MTPALFARLVAIGFTPGERNPEEWAVAELERVTDEARRLRDLVRHQRGPLHDAELITDEEYAALATDYSAKERLRGYDELRRRLFDAERDLSAARTAYAAEWDPLPDDTVAGLMRSAVGEAILHRERFKERGSDLDRMERTKTESDHEAGRWKAVAEALLQAFDHTTEDIPRDHEAARGKVAEIVKGARKDANKSDPVPEYPPPINVILRFDGTGWRVVREYRDGWIAASDYMPYDDAFREAVGLAKAAGLTSPVSTSIRDMEPR